MKNISDMKKNPIKKDFIVDKLMKPSGLYCLVARPKVGKSIFALQLANSIATGTTFLGFATIPSPILYISTEMSSKQILERIEIMGLKFNNDNFHLIEQETNSRKLNMMDLQLDLQTFANDYNGRFVIIDMLCGIDLNSGFDLNNYQDIGQFVIPKYRELCKKYNFTILLVHHLNKNNTSLGSTAIDGSVDGLITLREDKNIKNKVVLNYESRDFESMDLVLKRSNNLNFEISEIEAEDLNINLIIFLNYAISQGNFTFNSSEITSKLKLAITPSVFGKLLNNNLKNLEKEGLYIEKNRTGNARIYNAHYIEPTYENE
jgi:KaiC/GvpD/RAD55 family RecA-like ATPase